MEIGRVCCVTECNMTIGMWRFLNEVESSSPISSAFTTAKRQGINRNWEFSDFWMEFTRS